MQSTSPRIPLLEPDEFTDEQAEVTGGRGSPRSQLHISRTLAQHPALLRRWYDFAMYIITGSTLKTRDCEILILHTCAVRRDSYDLAHHLVMARRAGLTDAEIDAAKGDGAGLAPFERTLLKAVDELVRDSCIGDATWAALAERYTRQQLMDLVFLVGNYVTMSMATKTFQVPLEADVESGWVPH